MREKELRKKITETIEQCYESECRYVDCNECEYHRYGENCTDNLYADALIAAGIGDVWSITEQAEKAIQAAARRVRALEDEYSAMREAMKYLIDTGGADTCSRCAYDTKDENEPCGGLCVDGMVEWFKKNDEE